MINYIYDGTFEGLFTVIATAVTDNWEIADIADISVTEPQQLDLFTQTITLETDSEFAHRFFDKQLIPRFSREIITDIIFCSHSEQMGVELLLLRFIRSLLTKGEQVALNVKDPTIFKLLRIRDQVAHEIHRYHGFIRFRKLPNAIYYTAIEPDHNVIRFLAPHFRARFADQSWLIHDLKRNTGIYYDCLNCSFLPDLEVLPDIIKVSGPYDSEREDSLCAPQELAYQKLWNEYFHQITIRERENRKAQRQRMPERYWRHLVERVEK